MCKKRVICSRVTLTCGNQFLSVESLTRAKMGKEREKKLYIERRDETQRGKMIIKKQRRQRQRQRQREGEIQRERERSTCRGEIYIYISL